MPTNPWVVAEPTVWKSVRYWWSHERESKSSGRTAWELVRIFWEFLRESTPERRRRRYGDAEYDWERRVNTTSGGVGARSRFLGLLHSEYQPIEAEIFRAIIGRMEIPFEQFTFIDIGSGKGRAVLLAAEYPFRRIIGIELLPELHAIAMQNVAEMIAREGAATTVSHSPPYENRAGWDSLNLENETRTRIDLQCGDATRFSFPPEPLVVYLFNPLPESGLRRVVSNLGASLREFPRAACVIYVNPVHEQIVSGCSQLMKVGGTHQYSLFCGVQ